MEIMNRILDLLMESMNLTPLSLLFILMLLGSFLWLSKELKVQQNLEDELKKSLTEKAINSYSDILYEVKVYCANGDIGPTLRAVYASFPYIDYKISKEFIDIIESNKNNEEKIKDLKSIAISEVTFLSKTTGNHLLKKKLLTDDVENLFFKLRKIFDSFVISAFIIYMVLLLFIISLFGETQFWMTVKPVSFFIICLFIPFTADLIIQRRMNIKTAVLISAIFIAAFLVIVGTGGILISSLIGLIIVMGLFLLYAYRISKTNINNSIANDSL